MNELSIESLTNAAIAVFAGLANVTDEGTDRFDVAINRTLVCKAIFFKKQVEKTCYNCCIDYRI
jgi:hypothetical protein